MKNKSNNEVIYESRGNYRENTRSFFGWKGGKFLLLKDRIVFNPNLSSFDIGSREIKLIEIKSILF